MELARTLHGHIGLLAAMSLVHPAVSLRDDGAMRKGTRWSVILATALTTLTIAAGVWLYPTYRSEDKPVLMRGAFEIARLFETKEHLALFVGVLAWAGCALALGVKDPRAGRAARTCFRAAAVLAFVVGGIGSVVGSVSVP